MRWLNRSMLVAALAVLGACQRPAPTELAPVWADEWQWHHHGEAWVRGVSADGRALTAVPGTDFVTTLVNLGVEAARAEVVGSGGGSWRLGPGERRRVAVELGPGGLAVRADPTVVLETPRLGRPPATPRLVVLVVVDTLRADHLTPELAPRISAVFADGRRFANATANASWTLPSMASLVSSRPVLELTAPSGDLLALADGTPTWATALAEAGSVGAAVVANYSVAVLNGFGGGFSSYWVQDGHGTAPHADAAWVVERGRRWLAEHRDEDAFLYLHLMEPHHPYISYDDTDLVVPDLISLANRQRPEEPGERELLARLYAGEVRHVDAVLGPFLAELPATAILVLTADHGESLGERGCWGHGLNLYQESLAVPLLIRAPGLAPGNEERVVDHLATAPTLLDLAGVPAPATMAGASLLTATGEAEDAAVVSSTFGSGPLRWAWRRGRDKVVLHLAPQPGLGTPARSRMREGSPLAPGLFGFDLARDPGELAAAPLADDVVAAAGRAFAASAGRLVPGLQVLLWNRPGPLTLRLTGLADAAVVQAWSTGPMAAETVAGELVVRCRDAAPLCAVGVTSSSPQGSGVVTLDGTAPAVLGLGRPGTEAAWWNDPREVVITGHEDTLDRLRALGYIE